MPDLIGYLHDIPIFLCVFVSLWFIIFHHRGTETRRVRRNVIPA